MNPLGRCPVCDRAVPTLDRGTSAPHNTPNTTVLCKGSGRQTNVHREPPPPPPEFMTVPEVAGKLRVSPMTVYRLIHSGVIRSHKFGHVFRVRRVDLDAYISGAEVGK